MTDTFEEKDPKAELAELRERRTKILRLQAERSAVASAGRELLAQESTWPRKRAEVEAELRTAEVFDLPMLADELALADRAIRTLEASQQPAPPPAILAEQGFTSRRLKKKRRRLAGLIERRHDMARRVDDLRQAFEAAVAGMRDHGEERKNLTEAIAELEEYDDRAIDQLGPQVRRVPTAPPRRARRAMAARPAGS